MKRSSFLRLTPLLCIALSLANLLAADLPAQDAPKEPPVVAIYSGNRAVNSVPSKDAFAPIVVVRSAQGQILSGIPVRFELQDTKFGHFTAQPLVFETVTDSRGQATGRGYVPTKTGLVTMKATAQAPGGWASVTIIQRNGKQPQVITFDEKSGRGVIGSKWLILGVAAAVGIVVAILVTRSASSGTIKLGTPTVGGGA